MVEGGEAHGVCMGKGREAGRQIVPVAVSEMMQGWCSCLRYCKEHCTLLTCLHTQPLSTLSAVPLTTLPPPSAGGQQGLHAPPL